MEIAGEVIETENSGWTFSSWDITAKNSGSSYFFCNNAVINRKFEIHVEFCCWAPVANFVNDAIHPSNLRYLGGGEFRLPITHFRRIFPFPLPFRRVLYWIEKSKRWVNVIRAGRMGHKEHRDFSRCTGHFGAGVKKLIYTHNIR